MVKKTEPKKSFLEEVFSYEDTGLIDMPLERLVDRGGQLNEVRKAFEKKEDAYKAELTRRLKAKTRQAGTSEALGLNYLALISYVERGLLDIERVRAYLKAKAKRFERISSYYQVQFQKLGGDPREHDK